MTEDEARTRWCPFARGCGAEKAGNRMPYGTPGDDPAAEDEARQEYGADMATLYPCIASDCMAWRWSDIKRPGGEWWRPTGPQSSRALRESEAPEGYCGLAGYAGGEP